MDILFISDTCFFRLWLQVVFIVLGATFAEINFSIAKVKNFVIVFFPLTQGL